MPRGVRRKSITNVYHCIMRGINRQDIFLDNQDFLKFRKELINTKKIYSYKLYSYVLMSNHIHLQIKDEKNNLSQSMQSIQLRYSKYFNNKYQRIGHLFQNRFESRCVEDIEYFINLQRYIHQNPLKANISKVDKYKWSSYRDYINLHSKNELIEKEDKEIVLKLYSDNVHNAKQRFIKLNKELVTFSKAEDILEYGMKTSLSDEELIYLIKRNFNIENIQEIQNYNKSIRDKIIGDIKGTKGTNHNQISRVLGVNLRIVQRAKSIYKEE